MAAVLKEKEQRLSAEAPKEYLYDRRSEHIRAIRNKVVGVEYPFQKKKARADLQETDMGLHFMTNTLLEAQEAERRKIARELHDDTGQHLTVLKLLLYKVKRSLGEDAPAEIAEAQEILTGVINQIRTLSFNLRPGMLDDLGLLPALQWYFQDFSRKTDIRVDFKNSGLERELPIQIRTAAYRIIQEGLTNVIRYAKTDRVAVAVHVIGAKFTLQIQDEGIGFEPAKVALTSSGLRGIRERTQYLGGRLIVESAPGKGTCLSVDLPLEATRERRLSSAG